MYYLRYAKPWSGLHRYPEIFNLHEHAFSNNCKKLRSITKATVKVAEQSISKAVAEIANGSQDVTDINVSCDGTWQRRGFSSLRLMDVIQQSHWIQGKY